MKLLLPTFAALIALSAADRTRGLKRFGGDLESKMDSMCPDLLSKCDTSLDSGDCELGERPERPSLDASQDEKDTFKEMMKERKELTLLCLCCDELGVEEVLASRPSGGSGGSRPSEGGRPGGFGGGGGGSRPKPTPDDIQSKLDEKCGEFDCDSVDPESVDCARFDGIMSGAVEVSLREVSLRGGRGGRRKTMLYCGCGCREGADADFAEAEGRLGEGSTSLFESTIANGDGGDNSDSMSMSEDYAGSSADSDGEKAAVEIGNGRPGGRPGGRPLGAFGGSGGGSRSVPIVADIQTELDQRCGDFDCDSVDAENVNCARFDAIMSGTSGDRVRRRERKGTMLYCGCGCRGADRG